MGMEIHYKHIREITDTANNKIEEAIKGITKPIKLPWDSMNQALLGLFQSDFIVIAGRPGSGKSAMANQILFYALEAADNKDMNVVAHYDSLEMPSYQHILRQYAGEMEIPVKCFRNSYDPISEEDYKRVKGIAERLKSLNIFFNDNPITPYQWYDSAVRICEKEIPKGNIPLFMIDHSRLPLSEDKKQDEQSKLNDLATKANFIKNKGAIVIIISQMNRDIEKDKDRRRIGLNPPVMADVFGSSSFEQFATCVIALHNPEQFGIVSGYLGYEDHKGLIFAHILKQREGWIGAKPLKNNLKNMRLENSEEEQ